MANSRQLLILKKEMNFQSEYKTLESRIAHPQNLAYQKCVGL